MWALGPNDILEANLDNLKKIYCSFHSSVKKYIDLNDCIDMCTRRADLGLMDKDIQIPYTLCKMIVSNEPTQYSKY